ncbi:MAG: hypothetical protein K0R10_2709 [Alphaproteobacteria bacterium]|jgi:hypothetical protein|nr:hypothetical protein [Alphaproteobacteria bacterium]
MAADDIVPLTMPSVEGMGLSVDLQKGNFFVTGKYSSP